MRGKRIQLAGLRFGLWTVIAGAGPLRVRVRCNCGRETTVLRGELTRARGNSRGCISCVAACREAFSPAPRDARGTFTGGAPC